MMVNYLSEFGMVLDKYQVGIRAPKKFYRVTDVGDILKVIGGIRNED